MRRTWLAVWGVVLFVVIGLMLQTPASAQITLVDAVRPIDQGSCDSALVRIPESDGSQRIELRAGGSQVSLRELYESLSFAQEEIPVSDTTYFTWGSSTGAFFSTGTVQVQQSRGDRLRQEATTADRRDTGALRLRDVVKRLSVVFSGLSDCASRR